MPVRVLIVDDLEGFRHTAATVIRTTAGFELAGEAADGEASLEAVRALAPDIVLMDVRLPGISGIEATRRILADAPRTTVVLMSTSDGNDFAAVAAECGAAAYLPKSRLSPRELTRLWTERPNS